VTAIDAGQKHSALFLIRHAWPFFALLAAQYAFIGLDTSAFCAAVIPRRVRLPPAALAFMPARRSGTSG
jgi:hypothetical protein